MNFIQQVAKHQILMHYANQGSVYVVQKHDEKYTIYTQGHWVSRYRKPNMRDKHVL